MADKTQAPAPETEVDPNAPDKAQYKAKLTIATIHGKPERAKTENAQVPVATFIGIATGVKEVENTNDPNKPYTAVTGNFEAVNMYNGEVFRSGVLYLPSGMHDLVVSMLMEIKDDDDRPKFDKPSVQFALAIDAEPANTKAGYTYIGRSLLPPAKADPLDALRAISMKLNPLMLPAPQPAAAA